MFLTEVTQFFKFAFKIDESVKPRAYFEYKSKCKTKNKF